MGIKNLESYLLHHSNSRTYFQDFTLGNCNLVIDGGSIPIALYNWKYTHWSTGYAPVCYGGDYDRYAYIVKRFLRLLARANINFLIVFGTRNIRDNLPLVKQHLNKQCEIASKITSYTERLKSKVELEPSEELTRNLLHNQMKQMILKAAVPSAALKGIFRDIVNELNFNVLTVEGDADQQIASYARELKCPVLSADSDFFLVRAMFIPLSTVQINTHVSFPEYIPCKIYIFEKLADSLNQGPDKAFIPYLLPVLLGNDYLEEDVFNSFFDTFIQYDREFKNNKIKGAIQWLNNVEFLESALRDILNSFTTDEEKRSIFMKIKRVIMGYSPVSSERLRNRFCPSNCGHQHGVSRTFINFETLQEALGLELEEIRHAENVDTIVSELFMRRILECRYPAFFVEMAREDIYVLQTNLDDRTRPDANSIGYTIIAAIYKILLQNNDKQLTVLRRNSDNLMEEHVLPAFTDQLPSIEHIEHLFLEERQGILLKILEINQNFLELTERHSQECHLLLLTLKYTVSKSELEPSFRYSIILCFIVLNYIDTNIGGRGLLYRTYEDLQRHHPGFNLYSPYPELGQSYLFMHSIIRYFQMDRHDTDENYDRGVMHSIAEFQCVFLHLKHLNNLLNFPFQDASIYKIFNGTFVYNMITNLRKQTNLKKYCLRLLNECPLFRSKISFALLQKHSIL